MAHRNIIIVVIAVAIISLAATSYYYKNSRKAHNQAAVTNQVAHIPTGDSSQQNPHSNLPLQQTTASIPTSRPRSESELVKSLLDINKRVFQLAILVYETPNRRSEFHEESVRLQKDLNDIVKELEINYPSIRSKFRSQISDSIVDVNYIIGDSTSHISFRLREYIEETTAEKSMREKSSSKSH